MSRYNSYSGSGTGSGEQEFDDTQVKLQKYAAVRVTGDRLSFSSHQKYGDSFITGFQDGAVLDGIVLQRDDKPDTWKVFGFGDMGFNVGEDGLVYEAYDADADEYTDQLSAEDILNHARIQGFQETFGGDSYWYTPVGVVIEESGDVAVNDEIEFDTPEVQNAEIPIGETSMLLSNKSWVRTLAKLLTEKGDDIIATETDDDGNEVPVRDDHSWLTTDDPTLRDGLEGREMELFVIEETFTPDGDDEEQTYTTPILLDAKTGERITLDNDVSDLEDSDDNDAKTQSESGESTSEEATAVADGGATQTQSESETDAATTESPDTPDASGDGLPEDVPEVLDDLIDYFARTQGEVEPDELRDFAADEVDNPDDVDWEAAAAEVPQRA